MSKKSIQEIENEIISEFSIFDDWMDKYSHIIEMGKALPLIDPKFKVKNNLIDGCQSKVWLHAKFENGVVLFSADSDAVITKGIASMLIRVMNQQTPDDILKADLSFVENIGLKEHLSPTRSNGLMSMIKQMKLYALVFQKKSKI